MLLASICATLIYQQSSIYFFLPSSNIDTILSQKGYLQKYRTEPHTQNLANIIPRWKKSTTYTLNKY